MRSLFWLRLVFLALMLGLLFSYVDMGEVLRRFDLHYGIAIVVSQIPVFVGIVLTAWRHAFLVSSPPPPLWPTVQAIALGIGLNNLLPGRVGELVKATYLREHCQIPLTVGMSVVFVDRLLDVVVLGLLGILGISIFTVDLGGTGFLLMAGLPVLGVLFAPRLAPVCKRLLGRLPWPEAVGFSSRLIDDVLLRIRPTLLGMGLGVGLVIWLCFAAGIAAFVNLASAHPLGVYQTFFVLLMVVAGSAVPALPGGMGTYEVAGIFAFRQLGYELDEAVALTLGLRVANLAFTVPWALIVASHQPMGLHALWRDLRSGQLPPPTDDGPCL